MSYAAITDADRVTAAWNEFCEMLGLRSHGAKREHKDRGFCARRFLREGRNGPRDIIELKPVVRPEQGPKTAWISVKAIDPPSVQGLIVIDQHQRRYITHSGRFNKGEKSFRDKTWFHVEGDTKEQRYMVTPIDGVSSTELLDNVGTFARKCFSHEEGIHGSEVFEKKASRLSGSTPSEPLNRIMYGPPGTGKTFDAVQEAVRVIDENLAKKDHKVLKDRFDELRKDGQVEFVTFHQSYAYEDFVEGIRPELKGRELTYKLHDGVFKKFANEARKPENEGKNFVLIIDEINRGNIAKIFGELITLIEGSKRLGKDDSAQATLPYSGKPFGVPGNLYLIGTMNTADRGIRQLDMALRRRFTFHQRMPDASKVPAHVDRVDCRTLLATMNERIVEHLDRDHQIGHTYLMNVKTLDDLARAFQTEIVPLLQEYFYDNWEKMRLVLNENCFITKKPGSDPPVFDVLPSGHVGWDTADSYIAIYNGESGQDAGA